MPAPTRRSTPLPTFVLITALVAACGGGSSTAPSASAGPTVGSSSTPAESARATTGATPAPSGGPEGSTAADGSSAFAAATTALDALDSYTFRVEVNSSSVNGSVVDTNHSIFSGIVVNGPDKASSLDMQELDADGTVTSDSAIVVVGSQAWTSDAGMAGPWTAIPSAYADTFIQSMTAFRPEQMFGLYFAGIGSDFHAVGTETKNGVSATHYQGDEAIGALLGAIAQVQGSWTSDVWIANDGGFLVHSEAGAQGSSADGSGSFMVVVDITDPNASGPIQPPA